MVIESFLFLAKKLSPSYDNTIAPKVNPVQNRKRPFSHLNEQDNELDMPSRSPRLDPPRPIQAEIQPTQILQPSTSSDFDVKPFIEESNTLDNTANDVEFFVQSLQSSDADIDSQGKIFLVVEGHLFNFFWIFLF